MPCFGASNAWRGDVCACDQGGVREEKPSASGDAVLQGAKDQARRRHAAQVGMLGSRIATSHPR